MFTHTQDMFCTEWADASFDIVFNNGVLEHYDSKQRAAALAEAARLTRHGGLVIVGVPNHCSLPYRSAYLLRRALGKWHYPPEEKIRDFGKELAEVRSLRQRQLLFFDQETIFRILPRHQLTALPFRWLHGVCKFEPYLRVFELERVAV